MYDIELFISLRFSFNFSFRHCLAGVSATLCLKCILPAKKQMFVNTQFKLILPFTLRFDVL